MTARHFSLRFSACFAFLMMGTGVQLPFLPLWLHAKGLTAAEIATVLAGMMVVRAVASPLLAWVADRIHDRVMVIRVCAAFAVSAFIVLAQMESYWAIALAAFAAAFAFAPVFPLSEGHCVDGSAAWRVDYGRMRLWASVSFLTGSLGAGALLTKLPAEQAVWLIVAGQACAFLGSLIMPPEAPNEHHQQPEHLTGSAWRILLGSKFTLVLLAVSAGQASHALVNGFGSLIWTSMGFSTLAVGVFWTAAVLTEVAMFWFSKRLMPSFGAEILMCIGLTGGVLRWVGMTFATEGWMFFTLQMLHAVSFGITHLGTMHFIHKSVPSRMRNRAQGVYASFSGGLMMAGVTWASGNLYTVYGSQSFIAMAAISLMALSLAVAVLMPLRAPAGRVQAAE
jgi:MFS transporter, PPP family, 3-phenylpropionic acid transporter